MNASEDEAERREVLRQTLEANYRALPPVLIASPLNAAVIASPLLGQIGFARVGTWVLLIAVNSALNWVARAAYLKRRDPGAIEPWRRLRIATAAASGLLWGCGAALLLWVPGRLDLQLFALVIVCLTSAGALASSGMFLPAFVAFTVGCFVPAIARFAAVQDSAHLAAAIELSVLLLVLIAGGLALSRSSRAQLLLARQNERLIANLRRVEEDLVRTNNSLNERVEERTAQLARAIEEKHQSDLQLVRAQKMEGIGRLAGGVAHDFNNVLTAIMGSASLLRDMLHVGAAAARQEADEIIKGADRAARLTSQLLAFARGSLGAPGRVDLNHRLKELSHLLRRAVGETHRLEIVTLDNALVAWIDPGQFDQLVMNLVINAKDASPAGKTILVSLEKCKPNDPAASPHGADRKLLLRVKDEGTGMPPEVVERIFEPFFTTKGERGTGLGLSTCFGIVRRAAGTIEVESKPGHGSCFSVVLPLVEAEPASEITGVVPAPIDVRLREVLVVDDQEAVLRVVAQTLKAAGARVHEARSAEEALALMESHELDLDIVISDVLLPQRSGPELVRDLKARGYAGPVLLISGYMDDAVMIDRMSGERLPLLLKPFTAPELRDAVGRAMSRSASNAVAPDSREKREANGR